MINFQDELIAAQKQAKRSWKHGEAFAGLYIIW